jgi:SNF2 family DNA or RNA helicase
MVRIEGACEGGLLADEVGLGKTYTVLALLLRQGGFPTLVLCPSIMVTTWLRRGRAALPTARVTMATHHPGSYSHGGVVVCSYQNLDLMRLLSTRHWWRVVVDEAQGVKNAGVSTSQVARRFVDVSRKRWVVTSSPLENCVADLVELARFVTRDEVCVAEFMSTRAILYTRNEARLQHPLHYRVPCPAITVWKVPLELDPERTYAYDWHRVLDGTLDWDSSGARRMLCIIRCRQACLHAKLLDSDLDHLHSSKIRYMLRLMAGMPRPVVIFTGFTSCIAYIIRAVEDHDASLRCESLDGSMSARHKQQVLSRFQAGDIPVLVSNIHVGGVGVDMFRAKSVLFMEPQWNPSVETQALGRAVRPGQTDSVQVHKLVSTFGTGQLHNPLCRGAWGGDTVSVVSGGPYTVDQAIVLKQRSKIRLWCSVAMGRPVLQDFLGLFSV